LRYTTYDNRLHTPEYIIIHCTMAGGW